MRVALYARYSSDLQNERSAEDQFAALRTVAIARGWKEVAAFADRGISGATLTNRPGVQTLLHEAEAGGFDVILTEALDRLSRDQEGTAHLFKRLTYYGVTLETLSEGRISELHVGLTGTMNQLFLVELGKKTRRGLVARVNAGFSGGGRCYGYQVVGKGVLEIDGDQANSIRRIFRDYANGISPRAIAHALNAEGVPGPRGGEWTPSAIHGDRRAQDGILHQELYVGVRVFNRRRYRKHPETGRRSSVLNPEGEWVRQPAPELRILDHDLWNAVQARKAALTHQPRAVARMPKRLLSGLLRCAWCGGGMTLNGGKYACSAHRERGTCKNSKIIAAQTVERRVITGIRSKLLEPAALATAVRAYQVEAEAMRREVLAQRAPFEREIAEITRKLERAQDMYLRGITELDDLEKIVTPLKARRSELQSQLALAAAAPSPIQLHPNAARAYRQLAESICEALDDQDGAEVRAELRKLIGQVDFEPLEGLGNSIFGSTASLRPCSGFPRGPLLLTSVRY
jgi:site-specific DNA recombinase